MPPKKPKGKTSAYGFFSAEYKETLKRDKITLDFSTFSQEVAGKWKNVRDKSKYIKLADQDKVRYEREMEDYSPPGQFEKKKRKKKDANAPKRALSAFMYFSKEQRPLLKAKNDKLSVGEVAKQLGSHWKMLTEDQRAPYDELAKEDRERYQQEMSEYRRSGGGSKAAPKNASQKRGRKPKQVVAEEEDEEEEDEEDEDEDDDSASD